MPQQNIPTESPFTFKNEPINPSGVADQSISGLVEMLKTHPGAVPLFEELRSAIEHKGTVPLSPKLGGLVDLLRENVADVAAMTHQPIPSYAASNAAFLKFAGSTPAIVGEFEDVEVAILGVTPGATPLAPRRTPPQPPH